jgi:hypothetical protein
MVERRATSLLEFAIAASLAVVPIMLGILVLVAFVRPSEPGTASWRDQPDRYVNVRHVQALKTFEQAVVQRPAVATLLPTATAVLEGIPQCRREWSATWSAGQLPWAAGARAAPPSPAERIATRLAALDAALLRFSSRSNPRVGHAVGLDSARWFAAAQKSLDTAIEPAELPGQRFQVRCADLAAAVAALTHADARMLEALAWRGTEGSTALAHWHADQEVAVTSRHVMRRNPWTGIAGCIYLGRHVDGDDGVGAVAAPSHFVAGARSVQRRVCGKPEMFAASDPSRQAAHKHRPDALAGEPGLADPVDDARWMVPPSLHAMLQPLESLRQPSGSLYRLYTEPDAEGDARADVPAAPGSRGNGANRIVLDGAAVDVGFSIALTIDPSLQALAQKTAACYTGRQDVCRALGVRRNEDSSGAVGQRLLEGAMVRMAAVAVIDVESGRIEALAGSMSPCARQAVDGPGRDANCDQRLPYAVQYRPDALLNPAVYHDAMPASTIKPIMAAAFLSDPQIGARWLSPERTAMQRNAVPTRDSLRGQLMRSDSARFLDRMFCIDKGFANCSRPWDVQATALALGWNAGCAEGRTDCGKRELLFGADVQAAADAGPMGQPSMPVAYGRLMSEPVAGKRGAAMRLTPPSVLNPAVLRRCAAGADGRRLSDDDWEKCRGGAVVDVVAEGWGQGHARTSALGIAGMMATLAAAANGQGEVRRPHLVESVRGASGGDAATIESQLLRWARPAVQPNRVAGDAAEVILSGLSYSHRAGTARTACEQVFDARRCRDIDWLAGKTGTPSFPSDGVSLDELARLCAGGSATAPAARPAACSSLRPYKWYVAAYRADHSSSGPWTKVIAVLSERNWLQHSGQVHGAGDHGPNPSAEIAMQITGRQLGLIAGSAP